MEKALRLMKQGQKEEAVSRLKQVVAKNRDDADAAVLLAQWLAAAGQTRHAETILLEQVVRHPGHGRANLVLAELLRMGKRYDEAEKYYRHALRLLPDDVAAAYNLGLMLQLVNKPAEAAQAYAEACRRSPAFAPAAHNLAAMKLASGDLDAAEQGFARVVDIDPKHLNSRYHLGKIAEKRGRPADAESHYVDVLRQNPNHAQALFSLASLLLRQNRNLDWAEKCYKAFIRQQPESAPAYNELGLLLARLGRPDEAIPCFEAAIDFSPIPESAPVRENLVNVLADSGRMRDAIVRLEQMLAIWRDNGNVLFDLIRLKLAACDWAGLADLAARLAGMSDEVLPDRIPPYLALAVPGLAAETQLRIARRYATRILKHARSAGIAGKKPRRRSSRAVGKLLRVGYLFTDLNDFEPSAEMLDVIEHHDKERFEVHAYSFSKADSSDACRRIARASKGYRELGDASAGDAAESIRADKLDILIDLNGWTTEFHAPILAAHPAPVMINGWAYPASLGDSNLADFMLADPFAVPHDAGEPFAELLLRLPGCYRPAARRPADLPTASRKAEGLADDAFVFCSFVPVYQINPRVFDCWCSLLREMPDSVLWLADPGDQARPALVDEARKREIAANRIVFAAPVSRAAHLARLQLADLALDPFPLSAPLGTIAALSVGVPVVTLIGDRFAGRTSASLLHAAGCDDLIAQTVDSYLGIARTLASDPCRMRDTCSRLKGSIETSSLFDAAGFTRAFESICLEVVCGGTSGM